MSWVILIIIFFIVIISFSNITSKSQFSFNPRDFDMVDQVLRLSLFKTINSEYIEPNLKKLNNIDTGMISSYSIKRELHEVDLFDSINLKKIDRDKTEYEKHYKKIKKEIFNNNRTIIIDLIKLNLYRYAYFYPDMKNPNDYLKIIKKTKYKTDILRIPETEEIKFIIEKWKYLIKKLNRMK